MTSVEQEVRIADISSILAEMFSKYEFLLDGESYSSHVVFSDSILMPIIHHVSTKRIDEMFSGESKRIMIDLFRGVSVEPDEDSLLGYRLVETHGDDVGSQVSLLVLAFSPTCHFLFGVKPGRVNLDPLIAYSIDIDLQSDDMSLVRLKGNMQSHGST